MLLSPTKGNNEHAATLREKQKKYRKGWWPSGLQEDARTGTARSGGRTHARGEHGPEDAGEQGGLEPHELGEGRESPLCF